MTGIVDGETASGFDPVRAALSRVVDGRGDGGGAAMAAFVRGRPVVDPWAGSLRPPSLVHTWSAVKPVAGTCLLHLISLGRLSLDDPVVRIWPELTAGQDGRLQVRHLLSHAAGLATVPRPGTGQFLLDWNGWRPGWRPPNPIGCLVKVSASTRSPSGTWWARWSAGSTAAAWGAISLRN